MSPFNSCSMPVPSRARRIVFAVPLALGLAVSPVGVEADARPRDDGQADYLFQMEQGRFQLGEAKVDAKALIHFQNALLANPKGVEALLGIASIQEARGERSVAEACVVRALALEACDASALSLAGRLGIDVSCCEGGGEEPAARLAAAYLFQTARDGAGDGRSSLGVGEALEPALLHVVGFDAGGRTAVVEPEYTCSSGLVLESQSPVRLRAGDRPSANEWIGVRDKRSGAETRIPLRVIGPVETFVAFEARTPRDRAPERYVVAAGQRLHIQTLGFDAASNPVYLRRLGWKVDRDGEDCTALLSRQVSYGSPDYGFEPTGNVFAPPDDDPNVLGNYVVTAQEETSGKGVDVKVSVVAPGGDATQATKNPGKIEWTASTFEEGLAQAAEQGKLLLVEFQATW